MKLVAVIALLLGATTAHADDDFGGGSIIFARGNTLVKVDARGKGETELATFGDAPDPKTKKAADVVVRSLRTDAAAKVLLADLGGSWQWMPLDGSAKTLTPLPCADGPAQLAEDGACVLCRGKKAASIIVNLATGKTTAIDVPTAGARLAGVGKDRKLVWAAADGVWSAPPNAPKQAKKVASDAPLRAFLPSPDGTRAVGVYTDEVYVDAHHKKPAEVLMGFALDGEGARRKAIKDGVPLEWSHDAQWVLVQDGASACLMHATGGEYKCWKGYTAASISPDGKFGLVLGNRDGSHRQTPTPTKKSGKPDPKAKKIADEPTDEPETESADTSAGDVAIAPPTGPLSLFRTRLEGSAFTESPALIAKIVDGAAVWVPAP